MFISRVLPVLALVACARGYDYFVFNGIGDFLCEYYGSEVCDDDDTWSVTSSTENDECMEHCHTCGEEVIEQQVRDMSDANPTAPEGSQLSWGDSSTAWGKCGSGVAWTIVFKDQISCPTGQLDEISFQVDPTCPYTYNDGIMIGIYKPSDFVPGSPCSFELESSLTLEKPLIADLLGGATSGMVNYTLTEPQRRAMEFADPGTNYHIGFRTPVATLVSYSISASTTDNVCADRDTYYEPGEGFNITTVATRTTREYGFAYKCTSFTVPVA